MLPIIASGDEATKLIDAKVEGKTYTPKQINSVPSQFKKWIEDNKERIDKANARGALPYWLKDNPKFAEISVNMNTKRYTPEEFALVKEIARNTLEYGRKNIIGKYKFDDSVFGGVSAKFTRNSFQENLRYGEAFNDKVEMIKKIDSLLKDVSYDRFEENAKPSQKPDVEGYFVFKGNYKNNYVEYFFEKRKDKSIIFHFIKLHKK